MFSPRKPAQSLPVRTPSHSPKPSTSHFTRSVPSLFAFARTRLGALVTFLVVSLLLLTTRSRSSSELAGPPTEYNPSYSLYSRFSFSGNRKAGFPRKGLAKGLWKTLDKLQHRRFVIQPTPDRWLRQTSMEEEVYWGKDPLFAHPPNPSSHSPTVDRTPPYGTRGSDELSAAMWDVSPIHTIPVLPRAPLVPSGAPRTERLMFGTVTTVERAMVMSTLWTRWLVPLDARPTTSTELPVSLNGDTVDASEDDNYSERAADNIERPSCLILLADTEKPKEIAALRKLMRAKGLRCKVKTSSYKRYEVRVLSLGKELRDYATELGSTYDWFVFGDDDTFWLDILTLRRTLAKYDPSLMWFVGATTEAKNQLEAFGRMAFGGAGMIISDPLSRKMYDIWDVCYTKYHHVFGGDEMITRCAALAKGATKQTVTTEEKGMHQFDVPGDTTGVLQSGIPFLTLHHYMGGSWVHLFGYGSYMKDFEQITLIQRVLDFVGGDNMFRRYAFEEGKWLLVQGYSLTVFEEPLVVEDLALMEHTWYEGYRLSYEDRPMILERHDSQGAGYKIKQTFYIDDIKILNSHSAIFTYAMADAWDEKLPSSQRVRMEVLWDGCWDDPAKPGCQGGVGGAGK